MFLSDSSFIVLYTRDVEKTYEFYRLLGLEIKEKELDKVVVELGGFGLHFILSTSEPHEYYRKLTTAERYGDGVIFYIGAIDIEQVYKQIKESGGVIRADMFENHWGCREFLFEDPNGYAFAVYE